ncbi:MAG TPA: XdhC family protein [Polyangiaceae bacterium]|nr:XdhC family protein [Polyangiaceae bacterium]
MSELSQICLAAREGERRQEPTWLATVMHVTGSAYRQPGARMLFSSSRVLAGSISGGCLETSIARKGPWLARERPKCVRFDGHSEDDDESPRGTGCDGIVDILLERANFDSPSAPLTVIEDCLRGERRAAMVTLFESTDALAPVGARLTLDERGQFSSENLGGPAWTVLARAAELALAEAQTRPRLVSSPRFRALLEVLEPPPHLFVFGAGPDALPLVELARAVGFEVTVCVTSARVAMRERFAERAELHVGSVASTAKLVAARRTPVAIVMSHHYPTDQEALQMLLASKTPYIGMLGPKRRTERMLGELFPVPNQLRSCDRARIRAPLGLDLGAENPAQIALSAIAEVQAALSNGSALPLSKRSTRPIHRPLSELTFSALPALGDSTGAA